MNARKLMLASLVTAVAVALGADVAHAQWAGGQKRPGFKPPAGFNQASKPKHFNPVIDSQAPTLSGVNVLPGGAVVLQSQSSQTHISALNPNRLTNIDPNSFKAVKYQKPDGTWVEGFTWTSNGVPHAELQETSLQQVAPGVIQQNTNKVIRSTNPGRSAAPRSIGGVPSRR